MQQTQGQKGKKKKQKVKAGKLMKSKTIAKVVRNTRKKGKKQLNPDLAVLLKPSESDVLKLLAAQTHVGRKNGHVNMKRYIWKRRQDGIHIFNLEKTWAKLVLAARIIVTVQDHSEIMVLSTRTYGQRGAIKFAHHTGSTAHAGKWVPGTLTNPQNKAYAEPRLLIVDDPMTNFAALRETSYIGIPVIAFCNSDNNTRFVDCAIPCNNKGRYSIGLMFWFLAREVLRMRGDLARSSDWFKENKDACPDLFFYRDPNEIAKAKKEREEREKALQDQQDTGYGYEAQMGASGVDDGMVGHDQIGGAYDGLDNSWQNEAPVEHLDDWGATDNAQTSGGGAPYGGAYEATDDVQGGVGATNAADATGADYDMQAQQTQAQAQAQAQAPVQPPAQGQQYQGYYDNQQQAQQPQQQGNQGQFQDW